MILVMGVTARKCSESECLQQTCQIWLNYPSHVKNNRISWPPYIKNELVSMELLSFRNKMTRMKVIFVMGVTDGKRLETACFLQICQIWLNYA